MSAIKLRMLYKKEFGVHPFIDAYSPKLNYVCWLERKLRNVIKKVPDTTSAKRGGREQGL